MKRRVKAVGKRTSLEMLEASGGRSAKARAIQDAAVLGVRHGKNSMVFQMMNWNLIKILWLAYYGYSKSLLNEESMETLPSALPTLKQKLKFQLHIPPTQ